MSPQVQGLLAKLDNTGVKWWGFSLGTAICLALGLSLIVLFGFILYDALFQVAQTLLLLFFSCWTLLTMGLVVWLWFHQRRGVRDLEAVARRVELSFPQAGSHFINLVQFAQGEGTRKDGFREAALAQAASAVERIPFHRVPSKMSRWQRFSLCLNSPRDFGEAGLCLGVVVLLGCFLSGAFPTWNSSFQRILHPWHFVPSVGEVRIIKVEPGNKEVLIDSDIEISAEIENPEGKPYKAILYITKEGEKETSLPMNPMDETYQRYEAHLSSVQKSLRYRLQIGDSQTEFYKIDVRRRPTIDDVEVTYFYPPYLGKEKKRVTQKHPDLDAPQFTVAHVKIRPATPIEKGHALIDGKKVKGYVTDEGEAFWLDLVLEKNAKFTVHMSTKTGLTDPSPRVNQIRVVPDAPPTVEISRPAKGSQAPVGGDQIIEVRAADDHGLGLIQLKIKVQDPEGDETEEELVAQWEDLNKTTGTSVHHKLKLEQWSGKKLTSGQTILLQAWAYDSRKRKFEGFGLKLDKHPQKTHTPWHAIHLISPKEQLKTELARLDELRAKLMKILKEQVHAQVLTAQMSLAKTLADAQPMLDDVPPKQVSIQKATLALVESIPATEKSEILKLKQVANHLALGDMLLAIKQAEGISRIKNREKLTKSASELYETQDRIITVLRDMLKLTRMKTTDVLAEIKDRDSTQFPSDVQDKLRELKAKLEDFLKQQKRVIEATESLSKTPVEDFSDADDKMLKEQVKTEDDWSRFLEDTHSDFSKLPEQDFSNPSFLEELIEIKTELKMAKDALTKKATEIAVPLEQLGAEMAEEMTTNIEKWLPDEPDRERWSQEEPLGDSMKEAPMAELPQELEDLVGELMEDEEDLFDEMEDASSSWADSLDKGAGWDAKDGPISNMSAKGVTGNTLPNNNEIKGRSGEGRQGKASGEMVSDTAVGKGGRKTPSRLTPEPFQKGEIKDKSKDPVGGATGGGKQSGQGGQGLQGPVPNRPKDNLQRLTKKQAELRNKAEAIKLGFKVMQYHHSDLDKMIEVMKGIENDLKLGNYKNALRRKEILLTGLKEVRKYLKGEFTVRPDFTSKVPSNLQKKILGSMQETSPAGWEDLNHRYFEQLMLTPEGAAAKAKKE